MNLTSNFDKFNKPAQKQTTPSVADAAGGETDIENYPTPGQARNLCFVQADGKRLFLNYAYLVSGAYAPEDNTITLVYTTHAVTLKGRNLEGLYAALMQHLPRQITCIDKRYVAMKEDTETVVMEISFTQKE